MAQQNNSGYIKRYQHNVWGSSTSANFPDRLIPGPAGIIQAAILRKNADIREGGPDYCLVPTQEYVREIKEDVVEDDHFSRGPWLCAVNKLRNSEGIIITGCLGNIKNCNKKGKLELVVAVIKTCTPTALGELTVTLKDPTGTFSGTIHHKVLTEESGYKDSIKVGAVLVLRNVSVFTPKSTPFDLNITLRNIVQVYDKDTVFIG